MAVQISSTSALPAPRAFSTLKADVGRYVLLPNDTNALAVAGEAINDAIRRLNTRPWAWALMFQEITLAANDDQYDLLARFMAPRSTELLNSAGNVADANLDWHDPKTFVALYPDRRTSGTPEAYTVFARHETGTVTLSCPCSSGFIATYPTLRLWFYQRLAALSADADILDGPSDLENYVLWHAKDYLATIYDISKAQLAKARAEQAWNDLTQQNMRLQLTDWPA